VCHEYVHAILRPFGRTTSTNDHYQPPRTEFASMVWQAMPDPCQNKSARTGIGGYLRPHPILFDLGKCRSGNGRNDLLSSRSELLLAGMHRRPRRKFVHPAWPKLKSCASHVFQFIQGTSEV
jgi:hypothetical protein